jgi:hypothetical protein
MGAGIVWRESRRQDYCSHLDNGFLGHGFMFHRSRQTRFHALETLGADAAFQAALGLQADPHFIKTQLDFIEIFHAPPGRKMGHFLPGNRLAPGFGIKDNALEFPGPALMEILPFNETVDGNRWPDP